jgi:hypothetical protein
MHTILQKTRLWCKKWATLPCNYTKTSRIDSQSMGTFNPQLSNSKKTFPRTRVHALVLIESTCHLKLGFAIKFTHKSMWSTSDSWIPQLIVVGDNT